MPKQFELCKVCRLNHDQGKGHKYSTKHKQYLSTFLYKAHQKIKDVTFFLKNPARLRHQDKQHNKFWCAFCEEDIRELDSIYACSNIIRHLASQGHLSKVKKFWFENGADVERRHLYVFHSEDLVKWEDACKALSHSASCKPSPGAATNIQSACDILSVSNSNSNMCDLLSVNLYTNSATKSVGPLPFYKDGDVCIEGTSCGRIKDLHSQARSSSSPSRDNGGKTQMTYGHIESPTTLSGFTCIRQQAHSSSEDGNVHSGAPPPWLKNQNSGVHSTSHISGQCMSRAQERRLNRIRNPKRVGAAWAEKRRAEMELEAMGMSSHEHPKIIKSWLPNFGRVWQSGSRQETRKEFEVERLVDRDPEQDYQREKPKLLRPYISKRQRLEESMVDPAKMELT